MVNGDDDLVRKDSPRTHWPIPPVEDVAAAVEAAERAMRAAASSPSSSSLAQPSYVEPMRTTEGDKEKAVKEVKEEKEVKSEVEDSSFIEKSSSLAQSPIRSPSSSNKSLAFVIAELGPEPSFPAVQVQFHESM